MSAPDHSDIAMIEKRFKEAARKMHSMMGDVGSSITIIDYDGDRRKSLLSTYAVKHIAAGESAAAADTLARADEAYRKELASQSDAYETAQIKRKEYENEYLSWETARSLLARQRETLKTLPETEA